MIVITIYKEELSVLFAGFLLEVIDELERIGHGHLDSRHDLQVAVLKLNEVFTGFNALVVGLE